MKFEALHEHIPLARYGKPKSLTMQPYPGITLAMPGRHAEDTTPKGGDFVVMVDDPNLNWKNHQFKHDDIFNDVETKQGDPNIDFMMRRYLDVIAVGDDPKKIALGDGLVMPGMDFKTFLYAVQCLAVAEHRRYHQHEPKFGGRFLPFRFAAGIAEGLWTAQDAIDKQRFGRPAVERLEKDKGLPALSKELME